MCLQVVTRTLDLALKLYVAQLVVEVAVRPGMSLDVASPFADIVDLFPVHVPITAHLLRNDEVRAGETVFLQFGVEVLIPRQLAVVGGDDHRRQGIAPGFDPYRARHHWRWRHVSLDLRPFGPGEVACLRG